MIFGEPIFFDGGTELLRVAISAPIIYLGIICAIRLAGKRSTSQMNNFDWVVTVAMGSITASGIVLKDVTILEVFLAVGLLLGLQWMVTKMIVWYPPTGRLVKAEPALLVQDGEFLHESLRRERVSTAEVLAAVRENGFTALDQVRWVILETDATMSVLPRTDDPRTETTALCGVAGVPG
ncbi:DUF421 domain-containing protein [Marinibacterium profundimaris]|uniref:YetF C-terminal domain-containing protein n=1 Tax=Marinibacterium profundimaris TaxID=1679460 RepID=A0A225NIK1_9RHOB|nr:YetF domain-containing protein [Marinibacterium profundimaris]OWU68107.1 hypothetical protein ATO3_24735 [Marinibacterium profundimaris]